MQLEALSDYCSKNNKEPYFWPLAELEKNNN